MDAQARRAGKPPCGDRTPPGGRDPEQGLALVAHRLAVLVPVGVLARDGAEVVDEGLDGVRQVDDLAVAVDLHPLAAEVVGQHEDADLRPAAGVRRLGALGVGRDDDASLLVDAAGDRRGLRPPVGALRHEHHRVARTDEVEHRVAVDLGVGRDLAGHGQSSWLGAAGAVEDRDDRLGQPGGIHRVGPPAASHEAVVDLRRGHGPDDVDEPLAVELRRQPVGRLEGVEGVRVAGPTLAVDRRDELLQARVAAGALGEEHAEKRSDPLVDRRAQRGVGPDEALAVGGRRHGAELRPVLHRDGRVVTDEQHVVDRLDDGRLAADGVVDGLRADARRSTASALTDIAW